jgi:hypothetical protein
LLHRSTADRDPPGAIMLDADWRTGSGATVFRPATPMINRTTPSFRRHRQVARQSTEMPQRRYDQHCGADETARLKSGRVT